MNITSEVRDGKLYVLCFEELAEFLVFNSKYKVLFCYHGLPAIKVTKENFQWCKEKGSGMGFIYELELPLLEIVACENHNGLNLTVRFNPKYNSYFTSHDFSDVEIWREKEIEKRLEKLGSYQQLDKVREEVDKLIKSLPI